MVIPQLNASAVPDHKGVISYICGHMRQQPHMLASLPYCQCVHTVVKLTKTTALNFEFQMQHVK